MEDNELRYEFGANWKQFINNEFNPDRVKVAKDHLSDFIGMSTLDGKTFIDIGCGSGLSSVAAFELGASQIVSFDYDPDSVETTKKLREICGTPSNWRVEQGDILNRTYVDTLGTFDVVYSWGVLHHTGKMWDAVEMLRHLLSPGGILYIALYTTTERSPYWVKIKKMYTSSSSFKRKRMEWWYLFRWHFIPHLLGGKNPFNISQRRRGMSFMTDVRDWLGGYPYEDATIDEVVRFARNRLNMYLVNISTGKACTEYMFKSHPQNMVINIDQ